MPGHDHDIERRREQERRDLDARLDEQRSEEMRALATRIGNLSDGFIRFDERQTRMATDVSDIKRRQEEQKKEFDEEFVRRDEFEPIQKLVWRCIYTAATIIIAALMALIVKAGGVGK